MPILKNEQAVVALLEEQPLSLIKLGSSSYQQMMDLR
jgi:hypothetical protein